MTVKDIKDEARKKLALNMHQAIAVYTVEFTLMITLIALVVMSCVALGINTPAAIVMICYGVLLALIAFVGVGMANFAMVDFYLATYRCKPYNIRRLGETLARSNVVKIFLLNLQRTLIGFLLLLCLIAPGVIYLIRTSMANYLLIANPKMTAKTALSASNKVMSGKTGAYFTLCMTLIGWYLLGIISLGLGFIFILPYTNLIKAVYYKRNLQGDKNVYVVPQQPISPPMESTTAAPVVGKVENAAPPVAPVATTTIQAQQIVMPIDTLDDDDIRDMNATMRGFAQTRSQAETTVPEVPIMPITVNKSTTAEGAATAVEESVVSIPTVEQEKPPTGKPISHSIDGTSIVETERVLTTKELAEQEAATKRAIDGMYSNTAPPKPAVDYFMQSNDNRRPNDFVTSEVELPTSDTPISTVVDDAAAQVISDSEFDAFLREFDNETVAEAGNASKARAPRGNDVRPASERPSHNDDGEGARRAPLHGDRTRNAGGAEDRTERIRREREERLQRLRNKQ